ncbi:MAG TPA: PQQ-dependent sugar dehydrogenase [Gemmatimonadaceae bacterium]|nr:PQQ-dependent sugar dehydrogenase [Gemmatimonadaceae bacterium]
MKRVVLFLCVFSLSAFAQNRLPAGMRPPGCTAGLVLPEGFCATVFADSLKGARHLVIAPNGDVFVNVEPAGRGGQSSGNTGIVVLRDTNGDGRADVRQRFGVEGGTGIALEGSSLYATSGNSIVRYRVPAGALMAAGKPDTIVTGLPMTGSHHSHNFVVQGRNLYVNIGTASNSCQQRDRQAASPGNNPCTELQTRGGVWEFDANRLRQTPSDGRRFATGLRNSVALTRSPTGGDLWATVHGRDQLHDNWPSLFSAEKSAENPGEELVRIDRGADYGWPYCYYDVDRRHLVLAPEYGGDGQKVAQCSTKMEPLLAFPGHWAPNGMLFYTGSQFPAQYRGGAFVAFHGSWNRAPLPQAGFRVVFAPFSFNKPTGTFETFADGFNPTPSPGRAQPGTHRPTGLAQAPDGSLFVTDDTGGSIWRITYRRSTR